MTQTPSPASDTEQPTEPPAEPSALSAAFPTGVAVSGVVESCGLEHLVLAVPGTDYRIKLVHQGAELAQGQRARGVIQAQARRIDVIPAGGRFVEPVAGRPRRVQGRVVQVDESSNTVWVKAGPTLGVTPTDARQKAADFAPGAMVSFDVEAGATFTPANA
ncbi:MAG: hypothetical protein AAF612_00885 [Planctomycetota bacterium]